MEQVNVELLAKEVSSSYSRLIGGFLELSEGFFRTPEEEKKWSSFRKLVLDLGNNNKRLIVERLEGRTFDRHEYTLIKRKEL